MNILFLTLVQFSSLQEKNIYTDLLREFVSNGHNVYAISPVEKKYNQATRLINEDKATILNLQIGNTQKTNVIRKGISTLLIEPIFKNAIKKYFSDVVFDLVIYSTPPITFVSAIKYIKKRDNAKSYLLLKDIFPQNAVDIGLLTTTGVKGILYRYFRKKEKVLYKVSDVIGCMSKKNLEYIVTNNSDISAHKIEINPNSIEIIDNSVDENERIKIRSKHGIPVDKRVFIYGGNLGKPQGIPFLIQCLDRCANMNDAFFLIIGDGTEYQLLSEYMDEKAANNMKLIKRLRKEDYDSMVGACDVGMIFLDYRFTIPNYPSRLLSYMAAKIPVLAATDDSSDIGETIENGEFGWSCKSNDTSQFYQLVKKIVQLSGEDLNLMGSKGHEYLTKNFNVKDSYKQIILTLPID